MPEIQHSVQIAAKPQAIYPLVAIAEGIRQWWATDITEAGAAVELGFFNCASAYRLQRQIDKPPTELEWRCENGQEWTGTRIRFRLESGELLRFTHADWRSALDYFMSCNTCLGRTYV